MSDFKGENAPNSISSGAPPQTPLGELTAFPQTPYLHLRGPTFKGVGKVREREGRAGQGRKGGGGKDGGAVQFLASGRRRRS